MIKRYWEWLWEPVSLCEQNVGFIVAIVAGIWGGIILGVIAAFVG